MLKLILSIKLSTSMKKFLTLSIVLILTSCSAPKRKSHPILVWENIKLFYNDTVKFTVATNGIESYKYINASVLVFDKEYKDALAKGSKYKSKLISYFSDMIHSNNTKKKDFYEIYWKTVSPEHWKRINTN